jgi:uncharacterized protein (DUF433 family)
MAYVSSFRSEVMKAEVQIVDYGRGPQLSTSRVTVQDLVPYFQMGSSHEEIIRAMPILTVAEIMVVKQYIENHQEEVFEEDRRIREENAHAKNPAAVEEILRQARAERLAWMESHHENSHPGANGEGHSR